MNELGNLISAQQAQGMQNMYKAPISVLDSLEQTKQSYTQKVKDIERFQELCAKNPDFTEMMEILNRLR